MMIKGFKICLLSICSALLFTACNGVEMTQKNDTVQTDNKEEITDKETPKTNDDLDSNGSYEKDDKSFNTETSDHNTNNSDVDYNWWKGKHYVSKITGDEFYGFRYENDEESFFTFGTCCVSVDKAQIEVAEDDYFGRYIGYTFQTQTLRGSKIEYEEYYVVYYIERDSVAAFNESGMYSDEFYYSSSDSAEIVLDEYGRIIDNNNENSKSPETPEKSDTNINHLYEGQCFRCSETVSGEIVTLTIHLFYEDDSDMPSAYKGELDNGVEFWFKPCVFSDETVLYKIDSNDGSVIYMRYNKFPKEIEIFADEGSEQSNMYAHCGTYISLSDK